MPPLLPALPTAPPLLEPGRVFFPLPAESPAEGVGLDAYVGVGGRAAFAASRDAGSTRSESSFDSQPWMKSIQAAVAPP